MADFGTVLSAQLWAEFGSDLGLCALVVVAYGQVRRRLRAAPAVLCGALTGLIFGAAALISMTSPIEVKPGVLVDGRHVALVVAGLFGGPFAATIAFAVATLYRVRLGGLGVAPGAAAMFASASIGALFAEALRRTHRPLKAHHLPPLGLAVGGADLLAVFMLPTSEMALEVARAVALPLLTASMAGTTLLGWLLLEERRHYETEQRLAALAANLPGVVYQRRVAADGRLTYPYVSGRLREFWGLAPAEVTADPRRLLERLHPDDRPQVEASIAEATRRRGPWAHEYRVIDPTGAVRWMRAVAAPRPQSDDGGVTWDALVMEITALKQAEEELRRLNQTLERRVDERTAALRESETALADARKLEALGQTVGTVAHDFGNLLTVIIGNLDRARPGAESDERLHALLADALAAAERGATMIGNLLAFARRRPLDRSAVDVNATVRGTEEILRGVIGPGIELRLDLAPELEPALTNQEELERALLNLVVNARDAIDGGGTITVETRKESGEGMGEAARPFVRLTVRDTGRGMPPEVRARAFEPFYTTKRQGAGTGLGLSMVHGFARRSEGSVAIDSEEGKGTAVTLRLPSAGRPLLPRPRRQS